jgi:hypothetical protein
MQLKPIGLNRIQSRNPCCSFTASIEGKISLAAMVLSRRVRISLQIANSSMKFGISGAAVAFALLATSPALARQTSAQSIYCATREPGNPYSKYCDYEGWSRWRRLGSWDSRLDDACQRNPRYVPPGC